MRLPYLVAFLAVLTHFFAASTRAASAERPNILFIAVDDLRPEFGAYGGRANTPNLDRLAESGTRFERAYCQQAVCGASRIAIMCSLYPTLTGEQSFHVTGWRERRPDTVTLNQHFGNHGYNTLGIGKIYHQARGPEVDLKNWDKWLSLTSPVYAYALKENREARRRGNIKKKETGKSEKTKGPTTEMADVLDIVYADGRFAAAAVEAIGELGRKQDKPFFFAVGFTKPHLPFTAPKKYWDLYDRDDFSMPANSGIPPGYPTRAANLVPGELIAYTDFEGEKPTDFSEEMNKRMLHGYTAAVSYVDACIGRVLDALDESGLAGNTIVVLWGDHGWKLGDHSTWCKHTNFECDTRVPLIVRDPRAGQAPISQSPVELVDLYPTLCDLAGLPTPNHCQGKSFRALLTRAGASHRQEAYSSYPVPGREETGHSIRSGAYRYTEWRVNKTEEITARVLTDLEADPGEVTNLVDDSRHADTLTLLADRLGQRIDEAMRRTSGETR